MPVAFAFLTDQSRAESQRVIGLMGPRCEPQRANAIRARGAKRGASACVGDRRVMRRGKPNQHPCRL